MSSSTTSTPKRGANFSPIAIVGRGCVLPGALTPQALWRICRDGGCSIGPAPSGRWRVVRSGVLGPRVDAAPGEHALHDLGGYVTEAVKAPANLHDPEAAASMSDPMLAWLLYAAEAALQEGAIAASAWPRTGLIAGNLSYPSEGCNRFVQEFCTAVPLTNPLDRFCSGLPVLLAAKALGFHGPCFALDAACASSLYAIKLACDALHDGAADVMLAGGISRADELFLYLGFTELRALSPTGRSSPFSEEADGLIPAEGAGLVALKRLQDAERDGNRILGVVRGIGLSNDGRQKGFLAPDSGGQLRAMRAAYQSAGLEPGDVAYVECHATGTPRGDTVELESLRELFAGHRKPALGSVKGNLGHALAAAGISGLLRVLGALETATIPPTRQGAGAPLPEIQASGFHLPLTAEPWPEGAPLRAAISGFGFGGNNAHIIVEAWQPGLAYAWSDTPENEDIAICALGVVTGDAEGRNAFAERWFAPTQTPTERLETVTLPLDGLGFPPSDLEACLGQHTALLQAAREAVGQMAVIPGKETGVFVGMGCDPSVAYHGINFRVADTKITKPWSVPLTAARVLGTMPNLPANRIHAQLDWRAVGFTVSSEECSGLHALAIAARALRHHEMDAALVGAVDLSHQAAHLAAAALSLPPDRQMPADAAVALILKRRGDAVRDRDPIIALLPSPAAHSSSTDVLALRSADGVSQVTARFGHAHAASGLLHVAAAALSLTARARVDDRGAWPWMAPGVHSIAVHVEGFAGNVCETLLTAIPGVAPVFYALSAPAVECFAADSLEALRESVAANSTGTAGTHRLALIAEDEDALERQRKAAEFMLRRSAPIAEPGRIFGTGTFPGEFAFIFTGAAAGYYGMGREMLLAWPETGEELCRQSHYVQEFAKGIYAARDETRDETMDEWMQLGGSMLVTLAQAAFSLRLVALKPAAAIGLSSGETSALFSFGAWRDFDAMLSGLRASGLYGRYLTGKFGSAKEYWGLAPDATVDWRNFALFAPAGEVQAAVSKEEQAYLTVIQSPDDCVIGGDARACDRIIAKVAAQRAFPLGLNMIVHCAAITPFAETWRAIHRRETFPVAGVRFYTHATHSAYQLRSDDVANALTLQALNTIDFPAIVERAYADGVRIFLEHGPRSVLTSSVRRVLGDRPHLALALDSRDRRPLYGLTETILSLWAAGHAETIAPFLSRLATIRNGCKPLQHNGNVLRLRAHDSGIAHPMIAHPAVAHPVTATEPVETAPKPLSAVADVIYAEALQTMGRAPTEMPVLTGWQSLLSPEAPAQGLPEAASPSLTVAPAINPPRSSGSQAFSIAAAASLFREIAQTHQSHLDGQAEAHAIFLGLSNLACAEYEQPLAQHAPWSTPPAGLLDACSPPPSSAIPALSSLAPMLPSLATAAPLMTREQLEYISTGPIAHVLGERFAGQAQYPRQVRMPAPPLLLADRVMLLEGEAGSMKTGRIVTETDVQPGAWYLHAGRMVPGAVIESGQADLLLISWLGIDAILKSDRVYRLLGCELTFHGNLPAPGETLRYDIHVDGHAKTGDIRLFFFHYDCWATGPEGERKLLSVRNGQAGFFTDQELASSGGILWNAADDVPAADARCNDLPGATKRRSFTAEDVDRLIQGDALSCFGIGFEHAGSHRRTPALPGGRLRLIDSVPNFEPGGGPWGRGYLRAEAAVPVDAWFYKGHFHNDPCMPGTLMAEAAVQALAFTMTAMGFTIERDAWRFEPMPDIPQTFVCRGQVIPNRMHHLEYEVFVEEVIAGPIPGLIAALLCTCDGLKVFHCRRFGLQLVPDWPLEEHINASPRLVGASGDVRGDEAALQSCAFGKPSHSFGMLYKPYDGPRKGPRLPASPYHFVTRIRSVDVAPGEQVKGATVYAEYDVPPDAWYFADARGRTMPFAVLVEVALQPCGWLASYMGFPFDIPGDAMFRNLDGADVRVREGITPTIGTLTVRATLDRFARAGGSTVVFFTVSVSAGDRQLMSLKTHFGFFGKSALENQAGLPYTASQRSLLKERWDGAPITLAELTAEPGCPLAQGPLCMLDAITGFWPEAGAAGLGRIRARQAVNPRAWFFTAHFFQDPVQPGSLGLEALTQLLQAFVRLRGLDKGLADPVFTPVAMRRPLEWHFRGQVLPRNRETSTTLEITAVEWHEDGSVSLSADGTYWADGMPIYRIAGLSLTVRNP